MPGTIYPDLVTGARGPRRDADPQRLAVALRQAGALVEGALACARSVEIPGELAIELAEAFARIERLAQAGKSLLARRVERTGAARGKGHRDALSWLAQVDGGSLGHAKVELATQAQLEAHPAIADAYLRGAISKHAAKELGSLADIDRRAARELVALAPTLSHKELRAKAEAARRRARSEESAERAEARAHAMRFCRFTPDPAGGLRLEALLTRAAGAKVKAALEAEVEALFTQLAPGDAANHDHLAADALVRLVAGAAAPRGSSGPDYGRSGPSTHVLVRVDIGALVRGEVRGGDEVCEIAGIGAIPVRLARALMGDALFTIVLKDARNIHAVTGTHRSIPLPLRAALYERDPVCCVPGCGVDRFLEIDHWKTEYAAGGETSIDNLARLCAKHHAMKTFTGWRLVGGPDRWRWLPPVKGFRRRRPPPKSAPRAAARRAEAPRHRRT